MKIPVDRSIPDRRNSQCEDLKVGEHLVFPGRARWLELSE